MGRRQDRAADESGFPSTKGPESSLGIDGIKAIQYGKVQKLADAYRDTVPPFGATLSAPR